MIYTEHQAHGTELVYENHQCVRDTIGSQRYVCRALFVRNATTVERQCVESLVYMEDEFVRRVSVCRKAAVWAERLAGAKGG